MMSKLIIRTNRCKGCNVCVAFCPKKVLALDTLGKIYAADEAACIQCGQCELRCPDFAIRVAPKEVQQ